MISITRPLLVSEEEAVIHCVLVSVQLTLGKNVAAFKRRFAQVGHVRDAGVISSDDNNLDFVMLGYDIYPDDESVTGAFHFSPAIKVISLIGASLVFLALGEKDCSIILKRQQEVLEEGPGYLPISLIRTAREGFECCA